MVEPRRVAIVRHRRRRPTHPHLSSPTPTMRCTLTQLQALRRTLPTFNAAVTNSSVTGAPNPRGGGVVDSTTPDPIVAAAKAQQQAPPTAPFTAAHRAYVKSLYKRMLKNELDWTVHRGLWRDRCIEIRAEVSWYGAVRCDKLQEEC